MYSGLCKNPESPSVCLAMTHKGIIYMRSEEKPVTKEKCNPASHTVMHDYLFHYKLLMMYFYIEFPYFEVIYS